MAAGRAMPDAFTLSWFSGVLELAGGVLLTLGLFTRPIAFVLSGEMAFAYFNRPRAARLLPCVERRRRGNPVLLRLRLHRRRRPRPLEPRCHPHVERLDDVTLTAAFAPMAH